MTRRQDVVNAEPAFCRGGNACSSRAIDAEADTTRCPVVSCSAGSPIPPWCHSGDRSGGVATRGPGEVRLGARSVEEGSVCGRTVTMPAEIVELQDCRVIASRIETRTAAAVPVAPEDHRSVHPYPHLDRGDQRPPVDPPHVHRGRDYAETAGTSPAGRDSWRRRPHPTETQDGQRTTHSPRCSATGRPRRRPVDSGAGRVDRHVSLALPGGVGGRPARRSSRTPCACAGAAAFRLLTERTARPPPRSTSGSDRTRGSPGPFGGRTTIAVGLSSPDLATLTPRDAATTALNRPSPGFDDLPGTPAIRRRRLCSPDRALRVVDPDEYAMLLDWSGRRGSIVALTGIATTTRHHAAPRLRFDVGVTSPACSRAVARSATSCRRSDGPRRRRTSGRSGPAAAYEKTFRPAPELRGFHVLGLPVEERYLTTAS